MNATLAKVVRLLSAEAHGTSGLPPAGPDLLSASQLNNACSLVTFLTPSASPAIVSGDHLYLHSTWGGRRSTHMAADI